jgi:hypothetical protein
MNDYIMMKMKMMLKMMLIDDDDEDASDDRLEHSIYRSVLGCICFAPHHSPA